MSDIPSLDRDSVNSSQASNPATGAEEINVTDVFIALALGIFIALVRHKKILVALPAVAIVLGIVRSLLMPDIYTASTKILPPQQSQPSAATSITQLSRAAALETPPTKSVPLQQNPSSNDVSLALLGNAAALIGTVAGRNNINNDLVTEVLKSRTVADNLIRRFELLKVYGVTSSSRAREQLAKATTITSRRDRVTSIDVDHQDPTFAAKLANGYVDELIKLTHLLVVTPATQRRQFFEQELMQVKNNLQAESSARHKALQQGLMSLNEQERARVETTARLRAHISMEEMQIVALRTFGGSDDNPNQKLAELDSIKRELAKTEGEGGRVNENVALLRDLKYNERLYELLSKQYEAARVEEARDAPIIRVLDRAVVPDEKSKPDRTLVVVLFAIVGFVAALVWIYLRVSIERATNDPQQAVRLKALKRYLAWR